MPTQDLRLIIIMVALDATTILATTITVATEGPIPAATPEAILAILEVALVTVEDRAQVVEVVDVIKRTHEFAFFFYRVYILWSLFLILYRT